MRGRGVPDWWSRRGRRFRRAVVGYAIVTVFGLAYLLTRLVDPHLSPVDALIPAGIATVPLLVSSLGDRITGLRFFSVEVSLSEVKVELNENISDAVQELGEMDPSVMPQISQRILAAVTHPDGEPLVRVNLGDGQAWWSTRLFLLAALASDYTDIRRLVFVDEGPRRLFVGLAPPIKVRRSLATRFPDYEMAYRKIRANHVAPGPSPDATGEISGILADWPGEFGWNEAASQEYTTRASLSAWLGGTLDTGSIDWDGGPLTPLLRFTINAKSTQYVALTTNGALAAVVDRVALSVRAERDLLQARLT